jgi:hypothetical protein
LLEAVQPGALERVIPSNAPVLSEPADKQILRVAQAAIIALGRLSATYRVGRESVCEVAGRFHEGQLAGLSALARYVHSRDADRAAQRAALLQQLITQEASSPKSVDVHANVRQWLAQSQPTPDVVRPVVFALAAGVGSFARLRGWAANEVTLIIRKTHEGVLAGEAARAQGA